MILYNIDITDTDNKIIRFDTTYESDNDLPVRFVYEMVNDEKRIYTLKVVTK